MFDYEFWGNTLENWGISIIIILVTILLTKLISYFNEKVLIPYTKKSKNRLDDVILGSIESPVKFGILLLGFWIAIHRLVYPDAFVKAVDAAYKILIVLNITWLFVRLINCLIEVYWMNRPQKDGSHRISAKMIPVVKRTLLVLVWIIGIIMALSNVGVNISALLGTLGIGGIAFALAAQDTIKNIFSAFTILTDRPFVIGDTIKVDGFEGTIIDVGIRSTRMRTYDKRIVTFPNYKVSDASIENISTEPMRRVVMKIELTYDTTPEKMNEALTILRNMPNKVQNVSPNDIVANFSDFLDSSLVITFIFFIKKEGDIGKVSSDVNMEILSSFNKAGLNFAFPSQTLYVEKTEAIEEIAGVKNEEDDEKQDSKKNEEGSNKEENTTK